MFWSHTVHVLREATACPPSTKSCIAAVCKCTNNCNWSRLLILTILNCATSRVATRLDAIMDSNGRVSLAACDLNVWQCTAHVISNLYQQDEEGFYRLPLNNKTGHVVTPESSCRTVCLLYLSRRLGKYAPQRAVSSSSSSRVGDRLHGL